MIPKSLMMLQNFGNFEDAVIAVTDTDEVVATPVAAA